jgi:hypothetical protein
MSNSTVASSPPPPSRAHFPLHAAVKLMMLGLRDDDIIGCVQHGLTKISCVTSQANPVDAVFRMAAHMSELNFDEARHRLHTLPRAFVQRSDPKWQPDDSRDNCGVCRKEFRWSLRRHHCR